MIQNLGIQNITGLLAETVMIFDLIQRCFFKLWRRKQRLFDLRHIFSTIQPMQQFLMSVAEEGGNIFQLIRLGYRYANITGIDINDERIAIGKADFPLCHFFIADASQMFFSDNSFDLIYESTMFSTLPDEDLCIAISREMVYGGLVKHLEALSLKKRPGA